MKGPTISSIKISVDNKRQMENLLIQEGLGDALLYSKSLTGLESLIIALGGGAGIAAIINALGCAIKKYFEGKTKLQKAKKGSVNLHLGDLNIEFQADNVDRMMTHVIKNLKDAGHQF